MAWDTSPDLGQPWTRKTDRRTTGPPDAHTACIAIGPSRRATAAPCPKARADRLASIRQLTCKRRPPRSASLAQPRESSRRASENKTHTRGGTPHLAPASTPQSSPASSSSRDGSSAGLGLDGTEAVCPACSLRSPPRLLLSLCSSARLLLAPLAASPAARFARRWLLAAGCWAP
jgi:hypothetical protein